MAASCARFIVHGRVQGVFFRASTRTEALRLQLTGQARNLADGSVEVLARGEDAVLDALERWLHVGPSAAQVNRVVRTVADSAPTSGFRIG